MSKYRMPRGPFLRQRPSSRYRCYGNRAAGYKPIKDYLIQSISVIE